MGKAEATDAKKAEKKAKKRAKKEAKKEAKRLKKEQKRREKEGRGKQDESPLTQQTTKKALQTAPDGTSNGGVFYKKRIEVSLSLLPSAMGNIMAALEDSIRAMILKYMDNVGVLLTFENVKIIGNSGHGVILNELPHIHYKVAFDGLVFCPEVGCKVSFCQGFLDWFMNESFLGNLTIMCLLNAMLFYSLRCKDP